MDIFVPAYSNSSASTYSPYWAKVWPAAIGLCRFLNENREYITNKTILELAAGLGLPSIFAAPYAKQAIASDIEPQAVEFIRLSAANNRLNNLAATVVDWHYLEKVNIPDTLLLSDVNYEPDQFDVLLDVIEGFIQTGVTVILSTPQRLMAKPFITSLLPNCIKQTELVVNHDNTETIISILVLGK